LNYENDKPRFLSEAVVLVVLGHIETNVSTSTVRVIIDGLLRINDRYIEEP